LAGVAVAQTTGVPAPPTDQGEINALEREIATKERRLDRFQSALRKLEAAGRKSSNADRRQAIERIEDAMGEVVRFEEKKLGEERLITVHGQDVEAVHTSELGSTSGSGVRTGIKNRQRPPEGMPPIYLRLREMQQIVVGCRTIRELAIADDGGQFAQYVSRSRDFAGIMADDMVELEGLLPDEDEVEGAALPDSTTN
jgi:hypothetical protein